MIGWIASAMWPCCDGYSLRRLRWRRDVGNMKKNLGTGSRESGL
jgi:hypothetical protein